MKRVLSLLLLFSVAVASFAASGNTPGDVNGDGTVTAADITELYNYLLNNDMTYYNTADVNGDGDITAADITFIYDILLGNYKPDGGVTEYTVNGVKFKMVEVKGGTFMMGNSNSYSVDQAHQVTLSSFAIGQTEVTQELWQAVMGSNPSYYSGTNLPVEQVSWRECQQFITKLNRMLPIDGYEFRLPTEAEWEYAARGGNKSKGYIYAGGNNIGNVAWYQGNSGNKTHQVGTKAANELGLYDMSGNVEEWCEDWKGNYPTEPQTNPTGSTSGYDRILRGGYYSASSDKCQVTCRDGWGVDNKDKEIGLRLVLVPEKPYKEFTVNGLTFKMVKVKGGTFTMGGTYMGNESYIWELPPHSVTLSSFSICQVEVTQELWVSLMGNNPSYFCGYGNEASGSYHPSFTYGNNPQCPVEYVSWNDCKSFINKLNQMTGYTFRLPTEAEWEYAARGGNQTHGYRYAGSNDLDEVAWNRRNTEKTHDVATKVPNELGIYDMSGNVAEWVNDWFAYYGDSPLTNPTGPNSGTYRVNRGGGWNDYDKCRVASRDKFFPDDNIGMGFRLAM
ncbi:MAG: SUMF1/EgtB/PvdO family nonheme iron enzyme [Muribaculaceae bacterium]|nr:SUMF1/EgtB/PvdO family nonheme iron enzyme [Muribaculaceae bacterium]